jgi:hypothetical protein
MSTIDSKQTAVQYLKKMVFPYLTHDEKMLVGKFFYEAEEIEKEQIINACYEGMHAQGFDPNKGRAELYYNETYKK